MTGLALAAVFAGGGSGASCRYGVSRFVGARYDGDFPLATVAINVSGCFALGLLATLLAALHRDTAPATALLATGFLGGYTTFSTYALEGALLFADGRRLSALLNLFGSVAAGMCAAAVGAGLGQILS